ncbi:putative RNA-directed DNA polymerase [Lupinus albus]|uniref:Putative RNA-directed DNA polymerase n=1 Tax=Lupinus albus TaxID=3870 RepID=A0A6A4NMJ6_LUPAL|nr:putative RNA-directed DNA polymerase [Lupinus albus]
MTPEEVWSGRKPAVDYFRIFGCISYARIPDQKRRKLYNKGEKCIFLGVSDMSKAYKLYNPSTMKIVISRDVIFDEKCTWSWNQNVVKESIPTDFDDEEKGQQPIENEEEDEVTQNVPTDQSPITAESRRPQCVRRRPALMIDYEVTRVDQGDDPIIHFALFSYCDPTIFEVAVKEPKWRKAMDAEITAIERNDTWELCDLPKGH